LYFGFTDTEKVFDRVPREVTRWAIDKLGVNEVDFAFTCTDC